MKTNYSTSVKLKYYRKTNKRKFKRLILRSRHIQKCTWGAINSRNDNLYPLTNRQRKLYECPTKICTSFYKHIQHFHSVKKNEDVRDKKSSYDVREA